MADDYERLERFLQVTLLDVFQLLEKRNPLIGTIEPMLPAGLKLLFNFLWKVPERHARRRSENFTTAVARNRENRTGLRKIVCARETAAESERAQPAKLAACVPPFGDVHFAEPGNDQAEFEQPIKI
jgi:hypothetical protein